MQRTRTDGFTLVELMVTIAIVGILIAIAFPSFEGSLRSTRVATRTNELIASLSLARSEALRNPGGAIMCASANGTSCAGTWNDGWIVWLDVNGNGGITIDAGTDRVVRRGEPNPRLVLAATAAVPAKVNEIRFNRRGRLDDGGEHTFDLSPDTCPANAKLRRELVIKPTGQVQTTKEDC